jgi:uncharacterized protein
MSKIIPLFLGFLTLTGVSAFAYESPGRPAGLVNDFAKILTADEKTFLETKLSLFNTNTSVEVAVATVPTLGGDTIENFAVKLFEEWGVGKKKSDSGVLILVAPNEREARIEVGYGLEPTVTDIAANNIIEDVMVPNFREGEYFQGIDKAADAIIGLVKNDPETARFKESTSAGAPSFNFFYFIFFVLIFGVRLLAYMASTKSWWLGGVFGLVLGLVFIGLGGALVCAIIGFIIDFVLSKWGNHWFKSSKHPHGPWFFGGPGMGGRSGGGFGGFGGGRSGGGGASGRW